MKYHNPEWSSRLNAILEMCENRERASNMVAIALNDPSPEFIEAFAIGVLAVSSDLNERRLALLSFSHSARRHRRIAFPETRSIAQKFRNDPDLGSAAESTLEDFDVFVPER